MKAKRCVSREFASSWRLPGLGQAAQIDGLQRRRVSITMGLVKWLGIGCLSVLSLYLVG
jgi:hypothetical protein